MAPQNPSRNAATAAASAAAPPHDSEDHFQARPSHRLGRNALGVAQADGSTWQEYLAVCEIQEKMQIRSYFQNLTTGKRVWDEPPSGASHIIPASEEMHRMATIQLDELFVATTGQEKSSKGHNEKKKKSGLKSFFGLGRNNKSSETSSTSPGNKIRYKPGSKLLASSNGGGVDPQLQAAIAQSIAESQGITSSLSQSSQIHGVSAAGQEEDDDPDLAMAMALSLSTATAGAGATNQPNSYNEEEEMLRRALEASKLDAVQPNYVKR
ncbi:ubiquitin interaction motif-containing protein [Nitzschia inconspicua]|uniref:Ubiquitin interaction motif-containing protein n=1 Tax=Nitzschia inconspicua TaxID=303405 RepID=A0A9K3L271_9STRA|nr:ubiquitin interaction motif-containing protein [Nitzschia inconspicua]